jgi:hypothetical protein
MRFRLALLVLVLISMAVAARGELPTELDECVGPQATFCSDSTAALVDESCGTQFYRFHGRVAWPVLRCVGPVTIAVKTRFARFQNTAYPLYVEVCVRPTPGDNTDCNTGRAGHVALEAQGGPGCGGVWESVGPLDLGAYGIQPGENYHVQCEFFENLPGAFPGYEPHSVGFACIRVTAYPVAIAPVDWTGAKRLYR